MTATVPATIDDRIEQRLDTLREVLAKRYVRKLPLAPLVFLSALLSDGDLHNLKFDRDNEPTVGRDLPAGSPVQSMEIVASVGQPYYRISHQTRAAMARVASDRGLDAQDTDWMIDNYFIHELLHNAQGMSGGRHSELGGQAPRVLLDVDYQADALAAVTAASLAWLFPSKFGFTDPPPSTENHWTLYERAIRAVLNQMEIFTLLGYWEKTRAEISMVSTGLERILRIATWHYQYHRLQSPFRYQRPLADFQILAQPVLDFRNLGWAAVFAREFLRKDWPVKEKENIESWLKRKNLKGRLFDLPDRPPLIITSATPLGTTQFVRHHPTHTHYVAGFAGILDNRVRYSQELFTTLFAEHQWLKGGAEASAFEYSWMNLPKSRTINLLKATQGLGHELKTTARTKVLNQMMTPSRSQILSAF